MIWAALGQAAESAAQALIASAKSAKEWQRQFGPRYLLAAGSITPSRIAQGGPTGNLWTIFRQDTEGSQFKGRADAQLHQ